ncbi:hypothetical protein VZ142_24525, partial [Enterobacter hormaechei]|uniref:hypothetical protein n=1 Tax=Enterobacter hormaechei TaxID=158836 RepID=UPI002E2A0C5A
AIALTMFKSKGGGGRREKEGGKGRSSGIHNKLVETPDGQRRKSLRFSFTVALADNAGVGYKTPSPRDA